jgi:LemA protein
VRDFNTAVSTFPSNLFASSMGYKELEFFQAEEGERAVPKVSF